MYLHMYKLKLDDGYLRKVSFPRIDLYPSCNMIRKQGSCFYRNTKAGCKKISFSFFFSLTCDPIGQKRLLVRCTMLQITTRKGAFATSRATLCDQNHKTIQYNCPHQLKIQSQKHLSIYYIDNN